MFVSDHLLHIMFATASSSGLAPDIGSVHDVGEEVNGLLGGFHYECALTLDIYDDGRSTGWRVDSPA